MNYEFLSIPRGEFLMGLSPQKCEALIAEFTVPNPPTSPYLFYNEAPEHPIKVADFSISKYEVTNAEYKKFMEDGGYLRKEFWRELVEISELNTDLMGWDRITLFTDASGAAGPYTWNNGNFPEGKSNHPVEGVSWFEAVAYCRWKKMRLPSEAEWEYAARGSDGRIFSWGNDPSVFYKWGTRQGGETTPAGSIAEDRSPFGVCDLARNVSEWVADRWSLYPSAPLDPQPSSEAFGILRGGNSFSSILYMRTTYRKRTERLKRSFGTGFRCAK
jgi:formylglycine-generating enzyme required for sulfatase activity